MDHSSGPFFRENSVCFLFMTKVEFLQKDISSKIPRELCFITDSGTKVEFLQKDISSKIPRELCFITDSGTGRSTSLF